MTPPPRRIYLDGVEFNVAQDVARRLADAAAKAQPAPPAEQQTPAEYRAEVDAQRAIDADIEQAERDQWRDERIAQAVAARDLINSDPAGAVRSMHLGRLG